MEDRNSRAFGDELCDGGEHAGKLVTVSQARGRGIDRGGWLMHSVRWHGLAESGEIALLLHTRLTTVLWNV